MGKIVLGVMLGCKIPASKADLLCRVEGPYGSLLDRWNDRFESLVPERVWYTEAGVLGIWLACHHGMAGVPDLTEGRSFESLGRGPLYQRALDTWRDFTVWADRNHVSVSVPELWLVPTEVA